MSKFKIISYIKYPDGTYNSPDKFLLKKNDFSRIVELYNLLVKKYCMMHEYAFEFKEITDDDLICIINQLDEEWKILDDSDRKNYILDSILLYKIKYTFDVLKRNEDEYVVFFDTDAIPSNPNLKLEDFIDKDHEFFVAPGNRYMDYLGIVNQLAPLLKKVFNNENNITDLLINDPCFGLNMIEKIFGISLNGKFQEFLKFFSGFNEGFFIVKNTNKMKQLFKMMCENFKLGIKRSYSTNSTADGQLFSYFLSSKYFRIAMKYMKFSCMGHHLGYGPYLYDEDNTFILHDSDVIKMKDREKLFEIMMHNKWWKPLINEPNKNSILIILKFDTFNDSSNFLPLIQKIYENNKSKKIYLTLDKFFINKCYEKFLNSFSDKNFELWDGQHIQDVIYI